VDILARMSRGCYEETVSVKFKLYAVRERVSRVAEFAVRCSRNFTKCSFSTIHLREHTRKHTRTERERERESERIVSLIVVAVSVACTISFLDGFDVKKPFVVVASIIFTTLGCYCRLKHYNAIVLNASRLN